MSAAKITPNVKGIVVCDDVFGREIEEGVFDIEGVRQVFLATAFPHVRDWHVFLQLECARAGSYNGNLRVIHVGTGLEARRLHFEVTFDVDGENRVEIRLVSGCRFRRPGRYNIQVWFWDHEEREVQKGERSFHLIEEEMP